MRDRPRDRLWSVRRSVIRFAAAAMATAVLLSAPSEAGAQSLKKVRVAGWGPASPETSFFWTTVHQGYFKDEGIEIEWVAGQGAGDSLKRVIAGDATFAWSTTLLGIALYKCVEWSESLFQRGGWMKLRSRVLSVAGLGGRARKPAG